MSTAKDEFIRQIDIMKYSGLDENIDGIRPYVTELEHSLQDSEERCKLFEDSGILLSKRITELEQQVEELKKAKEACGIIFESHNVVLNNSNSGYEKLVDIKIGSHNITKK